jgi:hypothetical protein
VVRDEVTPEPDFDIVFLHHHLDGFPHMAMWSTVSHGVDIDEAISAYAPGEPARAYGQAAGGQWP